MSYGEKKTIVSMVAGVLLLAAYIVYTLNAYAAGNASLADLRFSAVTMLVFIGIGVGVTIVTQIVFHILMAVGIAIRKPTVKDSEIEQQLSAETREDEMDKLIELKALQAGYYIAGTGTLCALVSIVLGAQGGVMLNIIYLSMALGSLAEGALKLFYYRKGVRHA